MRLGAILLLQAAALVLPLAPSALAQDASMDRAGFDAAAGRLVFQNVLLADPQTFASRPRPGRREAAKPVEAPADTGEASKDREQLDLAADRGSRQAAMAAPQRRVAASGSKPVRVILALPYGQ